MTFEELSELNEKHHEELKNLITQLRNDMEKIPIKETTGSEPILYPRNQFHQTTYDRLHFKGFGGRTFKFFMFSFYIIQIIIALKLIFKL